MTLEKLEQIKADTLPKLDLRLLKNGYKVFVGAGDCGIKAGSREILSVILDEVSSLGLNTVCVTQMGCTGDCKNEPVVQVIDLDGNSFLYGNVTKEIAKDIIVKHVCANKVITENLVKNLG